jgi:hypothetical protein
MGSLLLRPAFHYPCRVQLRRLGEPIRADVTAAVPLTCMHNHRQTWCFSAPSLRSMHACIHFSHRKFKQTHHVAGRKTSDGHVAPEHLPHLSSLNRGILANIVMTV